MVRKLGWEKKKIGMKTTDLILYRGKQSNSTLQIMQTLERKLNGKRYHYTKDELLGDLFCDTDSKLNSNPFFHEKLGGGKIGKGII
jgi:hypothetical protein